MNSSSTDYFRTRHTLNTLLTYYDVNRSILSLTVSILIILTFYAARSVCPCSKQKHRIQPTFVTVQSFSFRNVINVNVKQHRTSYYIIRTLLCYSSQYLGWPPGATAPPSTPHPAPMPGIKLCHKPHQRIAKKQNVYKYF